MITVWYKCLIYLIFILVQECQPLKCWSCSSMYEASCEDPFQLEDQEMGTKYFLSDCDELFREYNDSIEDQKLIELILGPRENPYCRKSIIKGYGTFIVHRGCSFGEVAKDCGNIDYKVCNSHACYEDGCNGASSVGAVNLLFSSILVVVDFFCRF